MALDPIEFHTEVVHDAGWYYRHIVEALQSDAFDGSTTYEMWASYLAVVLADREQAERGPLPLAASAE